MAFADDEVDDAVVQALRSGVNSNPKCPEEVVLSVGHQPAESSQSQDAVNEIFALIATDPVSIPRSRTAALSA